MCIIVALKEGETKMIIGDVGKLLLIPEQVNELKNEEKALSEELGILQDHLRNHREVKERNETEFIIDSTREEASKKISRLNEITRILENYTSVDVYNQAVIEIGTRFKILIKDNFGKMETDAILIHKRVTGGKNAMNDLYVSCDTQLGLNLKGCKVGDIISYKGGRGEKYTAEILKIYANRLGDETLTETQEEQKLR